MSNNVSSTTLSSKISENGGNGPRAKSAAIKEAELRGVIRVLITKNQRLQRPVIAARRLAKYYQAQKNEVERMKEVAFNYKTGMERAERRSAQLQHDLAQTHRTGVQSEAEKEAASKDISDAPKGLPFHLPSSARQIIDGLTTSNVTLMKSLQRMSSIGDIDLIMKQNLELKEEKTRLQKELDIRSSLLDDYEAEMSKNKPKSDAETLTRNIILQRKENAELKSKIRSYQLYVKQLREKNSAILDAAITQLDKANKGPIESVDVEDAEVEREHVSTATSASGSLNASRIASLKSEFASHSTGIQTDSGFYSVGSINDRDVDSLQAENELKNRQERIERLTQQLKEKETEVMNMVRMQTDMEQSWRQMHMQTESLTGQLGECNKKIRLLETEKEDSEMILKMMQERVDQVNAEKTDSSMLKETIKELEEKVSEVPLMQSQLRDFEEDIKAYGIERKQLIAKQEQSDYEIKKLRDLLRQHQLERQRSQPTSPGHQIGRQQQTQQRLCDSAQRFQQDAPVRNMVVEPWKEALWAGHGGYKASTVVADGASRYRRGPSREDDVHERQRNRQLQQADSRDFYNKDRDDDNDDDDDFDSYANSGTVKCEKCQERYPTSLIQDHFRDCSRE